MTHLTYGSVCSGIEAATVAWHPLGWRPAWFSEIEPFPSAVLAHHYPEVPNLGDMLVLPAAISAGVVDAPDILCGGTPCQAFSVAGLRRSLDDARGNLSLTFCEIANAIDTQRADGGAEPCIVFWENVPGVLNTKDNAFGCFLAGLAGEDDALQPPGGRWSDAGIVLGPARAVAWRTLDAQFFGLAQRRRRVFVVASARNDFDPGAVLLEFDGVRRDLAPSRGAGEDVAACVIKGAAIGRNPAAGPQYGEHLEDGTCYTLNTVEQHAVATGGLRVADTLLGGARKSGGYSHDDAPLVPVAFNARQDPDHWHDRTGPLDTDGSTQAVAFSCKDYGADAGNVAPTLRSMGHDGSHANGGGQVAVAFEAKDGRALDCSPTLDARLADGPRRNQGGVIAQTAMQVRRLTPRECERLQGFPDDYTLIPWRTWQEAARKGASYEGLLHQRGMTLRGPSREECPDGPRYKALGNSWAVPVVRWIGRRIAAELFA